MAKGVNSLEAWEVALIKAMLATGQYKNQQIIAYFSRPDRSVNQGRINDIKSGKIMPTLRAASEAQLRAFLASYDDPARRRIVLLADPLHPVTTEYFFPPTGKKGQLAVAETDFIECKETINWQQPERLAKAMAGLANNRGGYILVGVKNETFEVVGVASGKMDADPAKISEHLSKYFVPSIKWDHAVIPLLGKQVVAIFVYEATQKPVMCVRDWRTGEPDGTAECEVYFRYAGQTNRIRVGEMLEIIRQREQAVERRWEALFRQIRVAGAENVAIFDFANGKLNGPSGSLMIDEALLSKVQFIREGQFDEKAGAPALRLVGDVTALPSGAVQPIRERMTAISERDILKAFISRAAVDDLEPYLKAILNLQATWLPVHYFVRTSGVSHERAVSILEAIETSRAAAKSFLIERLKLKRRQPVYTSAIVAPISRVLSKKGKPKSDSATDAIQALRAIRGLKPGSIDEATVFEVLNECFAKHFGKAGHKHVSPDLRYACCYVDDQLFGTDSK